jgi:hypothetical protein
MSEKFIDKSRLNVDNSTNAAAIASLVAAASIVGDGLHRHPSEFFAWGPQAIGLVVAAFSQWMQGSPSQETKLIKSVLQLEGETNAQLVRSAFRRVVGAGVVPGLDAPMQSDDLGGFGAAEGRGNALDAGDSYGDRGSGDFSGASIAPPENIRSQAWRAADIARGRDPIEGTDIYPSQYIRESMTGDERSGVFKGQGEWSS